MRTGDLTAIRDDLVDLSSTPPEAALTDAPEHLFVAPIPESRASRLSRAVPSTLVSIVVHGALVIGFLLIWNAMVKDLTSSEPISVEIVNKIPGETSPGTKPQAQPTLETKPEPPKPPEPDPPKPDPPKPKPPEPDPKPDPLPLPSAPQAPLPSPDPAAPKGQQGSMTQSSAPTPALLAPPPEPKAAAVQAQLAPKPNDSEEKPQTDAQPEPAKPAPAPKILTAAQSDNTIPMPAIDPVPPDPKRPADPDPQARKDPNAALAAALPMNPTALPATFRAMLSANGQNDSQEYKGAFYGAFNRLDLKGVLATAKRHGMTEATVVLAITLAQSGAVNAASIVQSSGRSDVDAALVALIRGTNFPPPPPGAVRSFTPSISFGVN